ncbi:mannose-1-phosphate guanylyltransferase/mannose-6-phosphate isomerase [Photorhabdus temperata]|uniref:mannose-1-phosphate guanylyltransferase n=1 Tax=Photorhabdus temperata subsp. temperata Meg1 TaxID=1393735 RepID=A0A081RV28_PHOTE|nr:mannose-1-phosphate guanylyltransferase/mannose-6-phosphate isomerase [Photorhabdus temperata]KER02531.1 mannose-1-phosphate guanylyltransferase/mannose-6-phosphate isomerase [Photorhabdus temperata subsp. temperata Meg1]
MKNIIPVILAGGSGSRLWPLSRELYPKQFINLTSKNTMLQETVARLSQLTCRNPLFICNEAHRFIVAEQLRQCNSSHNGIILEPQGRNTAPAITLAALKAIQEYDDPFLLILAADHVITNEQAFINAIENAIVAASEEKLVTFGIVPTSPEVGYGYIKKGAALSENIFTVDAFVEKPNIDKAKEYLATNNYYWNSGMFLFKAKSYLKELKNYQPDIYKHCDDALANSILDLDFIRINPESFSKCPESSIDYSVMEKTKHTVVVPMDAGWNDVGSFEALWDISTKNKDGNVIFGDVLAESTIDSYIYSQNKLIATVGVNNLVIVETKDAVLVAQKNKVQDIKKIVHQLKKLNRDEYLQHREVLRPWGSHDEIARGDRFHVKHIIVKPNKHITTQIHYHRAEHWIVVKGTAKVFNGSESYLLTENESTYIPIGVPHSIENPGKIPLELIEVHSGTYLSEDDVIRIENKLKDK